MELPTPWHWPLPPGREREFAAPAAARAPQPCRIETQTRLTLHGEMLDFDPAKRRLQFRAADGPDASLAFSSLRRLTLTSAWQPLARGRRSSSAPPSAAAQERDYRLQQVGQENTPPLTGRCTGHVEAAEGMYLFCPLGDAGALLRVFVPRSAYARSEFGASAEELAARHWIASPAQLLQAIAQQQPTGAPLARSLLALGLLTPPQLERVQQRLDGTVALGEALVQARLLSRSDLQTALAHKMGFPLVDLERFPRDPLALAMIPHEVALAHRLMPLLRDGERLVVAVDRPGRVLKLRQLDAYARLPLLPVLALKAQILQALERQPAA
ncbi:MAG TPA: hypothetical protein PKB14_04805 [Rubrivivax sp.]|nr:hypothetical protein [Rubrivivax sp.]